MNPRTVYLLLSLALVSAPPALADSDIPTGAPPSPLFGVQPFSTKLLRFEEFGITRIPRTCRGSRCATMPLPEGNGCQAFPEEAGLSSFISDRSLFPRPDKYANDSGVNPWLSVIQNCVDASITHSPAEGRPPGINYAHQRWPGDPNAIYRRAYSRYFKTVTTGARTNQGERDPFQSHQWTHGEFGPDGLYYAPAAGQRRVPAPTSRTKLSPEAAMSRSAPAKPRDSSATRVS